MAVLEESNPGRVRGLAYSRGVDFGATTFFPYKHRDFLPGVLILPTSYSFMSLSLAMFFPEKAFLAGDGRDYYGEPLVGRLSGIAPHPNIFAPMMALGLLVVVARGKLSLWSGF